MVLESTVSLQVGDQVRDDAGMFWANESAGAIQTPLLKRLEASPEKRAILDFYRYGAPLQRLGVPEDLTPMVTYLLSDAAAFTTGGDFLVTGELAESAFSCVMMMTDGGLQVDYIRELCTTHSCRTELHLVVYTTTLMAKRSLNHASLRRSILV